MINIVILKNTGAESRFGHVLYNATKYLTIGTDDDADNKG